MRVLIAVFCVVLTSAAWAAETRVEHEGYYVGQAIGDLTQDGFWVDTYYEPDLYFSNLFTWEFDFGPEEYRISLGVDDGIIEVVEYEFLHYWPDENENIVMRLNAPEVYSAIYDKMNAEYGSDCLIVEWYFDMVPGQRVIVRDYLVDGHCVSLRFGSLSTLVVITSEENRQQPEENDSAVVTYTGSLSGFESETAASR